MQLKLYLNNTFQVFGMTMATATTTTMAMVTATTTLVSSITWHSFGCFYYYLIYMNFNSLIYSRHYFVFRKQPLCMWRSLGLEWLFRWLCKSARMYRLWWIRSYLVSNSRWWVWWTWAWWCSWYFFRMVLVQCRYLKINLSSTIAFKNTNCLHVIIFDRQISNEFRKSNMF